MAEFECELLSARLSDLMREAERGYVTHSSFLSPAEVLFAKKRKTPNAFFFGGYDGAEREIVFFLPEYLEAMTDNFSDTAKIKELISDTLAEEIKTVRITGSGYKKLSHRDYLGALLNLGTERSAFGDVCVTGDSTAVVFATPHVASLVKDSLEKVGSDKVKVEIMGSEFVFSFERKLSAINDTVASDRFDCVVASLCRKSRGNAKELILGGLAELDKLVVLYAVSLVKLSVGGVETLHRKALFGGKKKVVDLFRYALRGHIVLVVLVRREACPVALGAVSLAYGEFKRVAVSVNEEARFSLERNSSEKFKNGVILAENLRFGLFIDGRCADGNFYMVDRFNLTFEIAGKIYTFRTAVFENVHSVSDVLPFGVAEADVAVTRQHNESRLLVACLKGQFFARVKLYNAERESFKTAFADLAYLGVAFCGLVCFLKVHNRSPSKNSLLRQSSERFRARRRLRISAPMWRTRSGSR